MRTLALLAALVLAACGGTATEERADATDTADACVCDAVCGLDVSPEARSCVESRVCGRLLTSHAQMLALVEACEESAK